NGETHPPQRRVVNTFGWFIALFMYRDLDELQVDTVVTQKIIADDARMLGHKLFDVLRNLVIVPTQFLRLEPRQAFNRHVMLDFLITGHVMGSFLMAAAKL